PPGPWLYPADQMSDAPLRQLAAEITREKLFERLHQELPYHATVETEAWKVLRKGDIRIEQTIYVERESQRKIVLGKGGAAIKAIGEAARKEIAEIAEATVHLFLFVKVREGWGTTPSVTGRWGSSFRRSNGLSSRACPGDLDEEGEAFQLSGITGSWRFAPAR